MTRPRGRPPGAARAVACPVCEAGAGEPCHGRRSYHPVRLRAAGIEVPHRAGGRHQTLSPEARAERARLLDLARAKCHADRGSPAGGTSWAALASVLGHHPGTLRSWHVSPTLDRRLKEYVG